MDEETVQLLMVVGGILIAFMIFRKVLKIFFFLAIAFTIYLLVK